MKPTISTLEVYNRRNGIRNILDGDERARVTEARDLLVEVLGGELPMELRTKIDEARTKLDTALGTTPKEAAALAHLAWRGRRGPSMAAVAAEYWNAHLFTPPPLIASSGRGGTR